MGFTNRWKLKHKLNLIACDIIQLGCLTHLRTGWKESIFRDFVVSHHVFTVGFLGVATHHRQVTNGIVSWNTVKNLQSLQIPLHNLRAYKEAGIRIAIGIELGMQ